MKVLVACEFSGIVRDAFRERGHDAWSCDLLPTEQHGPHIQGDVLMHLDDGWDMMIAFPPCTHLACSGAAWFETKRRDGRQEEARSFFMALANAPIHRIAIENPVGIMSKLWRKPDQIISPWQFGDEYSKKTCLWMKNLRGLCHDAPLFMECNHVGRGEFVTYGSGKRMPKWYAEAWSLASNERAKIRSRTFPGIARAMAEQWG